MVTANAATDDDDGGDGDDGTDDTDSGDIGDVNGGGGGGTRLPVWDNDGMVPIANAAIIDGVNVGNGPIVPSSMDGTDNGGDCGGDNGCNNNDDNDGNGNEPSPIPLYVP